MKLFECYFRDGFDFYIRYFDTDTNSVQIEKLYENPEYYTEDPKGFFKCLLDNNKKLKCHSGYVPKNLKEQGFKPHGVTHPGYIAIRDRFWKDQKYNLNPTTLYLDIETTARGPIDINNCPETIVLMQMYEPKINKMIVLGLEDTDIREYDYPVVYKKFKNEYELLNGFLKIIQALKPLFVTAYNGNGFDFVYIYKRLQFLNIDVNLLGLAGKTELRTRRLDNGMIFNELKAGGIIYLDYLELYKSYTFSPRDSYALDRIAEVELGEKKVPHTCYSSFDGFRTGTGFIRAEERPNDEYEGIMWDLYKDPENNKERIKKHANNYFVHYGIIDTYLLYRLDNKLKLTSILTMIAKITGVGPEEAMGRTKPWERYIANTLYYEGIIIPDLSLDKDEERGNLKGGYVLDPVVGKHEWIFSVDLSSAYPNLSMRGFNISPETFVPFDKVPDDLMELRNQYFNNEDENERFELYKSCLDSDGNIKEGSVFDQYNKLLKKYNLAGTIYGTFYRKDKQGIVPRLVATVLKDRKKAKNEMLDAKREIEKLKHQGNSETEIARLTSYADQKHVEQLVLKILANSLYGALGFPSFKLFNIHNARSITACTRFYLCLLGFKVSSSLSKFAGLNEYNSFVIAGDTDSSLGVTRTTINNSETTLEEFYNKSKGNITEKSKDNFIKILTDNYITPSVNTKIELESKPVTYIKKHKVKKKMYKIKHQDKEIVITEDHSVMIVRDGVLMDIKPKDILKTDKLIINE